MASKKINISGILKKSAKIISDADENDEVIANPLTNKRIGLSVSDSEDYKELGYSKNHQKDLTIEFTRYLLVNGSHLVYGGDLRNGGYTELFSDLSFQYRDKDEHSKVHFTNYFGWPIYNLLKNSDEALYKKNRVEIKRSKYPKDLPEKLKTKYVEADSLENRKLWALSMSQMRDEMSEKTDARIFIGGALSLYKGFYPGIIEEGFLSLKKKQPVYLIGAFGGATNLIIRAIQGETEKKLTKEVLEWYPALLELYSHVDKKTLIYNLSSMFAYFKKLGISDLSKLNGLSKNENEILFNTLHFHEMIYYVLVGLRKKL